MMRRFTILGLYIRLPIWRLSCLCGIDRIKATQCIKAYQHILNIPKETYIALDISPIHRSKPELAATQQIS